MEVQKSLRRRAEEESRKVILFKDQRRETMPADYTVMNMSGIYESQDFYLGANVNFLDMTDIAGTNCYCDEKAKGEIRRRLAASEAYQTPVHFLDSGNYHYLSLFYLEEIEEDFELLLLDNHPDLQAPSFGEVTSCGGWVREALCRLPRLRRVYVYGIEDILLREIAQKEPIDPRIILLRSWQALDDEGKPQKESTESPGNFDARRDSWQLVVEEDARGYLAADPEGGTGRQDSGEKKEREKNRSGRKQSPLPLYISLDKDLLCPGDAFCNWSQGVTRTAEVEELLDFCYANRRVLGLDICGEISVLEQSLGDDIGAQTRNNELNAKLVKSG